MFEYIIKYVIGAHPTRAEVVAQGYYWTAINIYNPSPCKDATIQWKAARALPGLQAGVSSPWSSAGLERGRGFEIDNADIDRMLALAGDDRRPVEGAPGRLQHGKGFVVIRSSHELEIVTVYTSANKDNLTLHTERVPARVFKQDPCGKLTVRLNTNESDWTLVSTPISSVPEPADAYQHSLWSNATGTAVWVGLKAPGNGPFVYERSFRIDCDGAYTLAGALKAFVDGNARFLMNGVEFATMPNGNYGGTPPGQLPPTQLALPPVSALRLGMNTLRVEVTNTGGPMGLMLDGSLEIGGAACSDLQDAPPKP